MKTTLLTLILIGTASSAALAGQASGTISGHAKSGVQLAHFVDTGSACKKFVSDPACVAAWEHKAQHGYHPQAVQDAETNDDSNLQDLGRHGGSNSNYGGVRRG